MSEAPPGSAAAGAALGGWIEGLRASRRAAVAVAIARIFLAFAFVPAGLKKVLGQPFTDPSRVGPFHDFVRAFHAAGGLYTFVGCVQLSAALLLLSQRFATAGLALYTPILSVILVLCWTTGAYPTAAVVTLMYAAVLALWAWDWPRWRGLLASDRVAQPACAPVCAECDQRSWALCGFGVTGLYLAACLVTGEVYRPRGAEWSRPAFYVFPSMLLGVVLTWVVDRRRARRAPAAEG